MQQREQNGQKSPPDAASAETRIFYFSGTGNCLAAAKRLKNSIGGELIALTKELVDARTPIECNKCVLVLPAYAYGLPKLVRKFLKSASFDCGYLAVICVCGTSAGGTLYDARRLLKRKGQRLNYGVVVQSVENYVHIFGHPDEREICGGIEKQNTGLLIASKMIGMNGTSQVRGFNPLFRLVSRVFYLGTHIFTRFYRVTSSCVSCGLCEKICPAAAVRLKDGRPKFNPRLCNHCQGCLNLCPQRAIKYLKITPDSPRYINPEVDAEEFIKRS